MTKEWGKGLRRTPHTLLPTKVCPNMYSCETNRQLYTKYIQRTTTRSYGPGQFRQSTSSCVLLRLTDLSGGGMPHLQRAVIRSTDNSVAMELQTCHLWWKCRGGGLLRTNTCTCCACSSSMVHTQTHNMFVVSPQHLLRP